MNGDSHFDLQHTPRHVCVRFNTERPVLSSAVYNGGCGAASNILIMKLEETRNSCKDAAQKPEATLADYCRQLELSGTTVGMMTSASMNSFRLTSRSSQGVEMTAMVTAGLSNARCAGDRAEWRKIRTDDHPTGTINLVISTNASLSNAAMVEAVMLATEAKTVAMRRLGVKSPVSDEIATGTGTDAIAVVNGFGTDTIRYCGKHVLMGEMLTSAVIEAITESLGDRL